jgi:hypothetical protein
MFSQTKTKIHRQSGKNPIARPRIINIFLEDKLAAADIQLSKTSAPAVSQKHHLE